MIDPHLRSMAMGIVKNGDNTPTIDYLNFRKVFYQKKNHIVVGHIHEDVKGFRFALK